MRYLTLISLMLAISILLFNPTNARAQNCGSITGGRFKKQRMGSWTGLTSSKNFYTLVVQKVLYDSAAAPVYSIFLNAASRVTLTDSLLHTMGRIELLLADSSALALDSVIYSNNPLGTCCALGFKAYITEAQVKALSRNPVAALAVKGMFTTVFPHKSQERQKNIFACLLDQR